MKLLEGTLEEKLERAFTELNISKPNQESIQRYLHLLKDTNEGTYQHSIRVGLLGREAAESLSLDQKALFYAGTLHDVGKALVNPELLKKKDLAKEEMEEIWKHLEYSYQLLRGIHPFSAEIALRHHRFKYKDRKRKDWPEFGTAFPPETIRKINDYAQILSLVDFYDAITLRDDYKWGKEKLTKTEIKEVFLREHFGQKEMIKLLYSKGIFV